MRSFRIVPFLVLVCLLAVNPVQAQSQVKYDAMQIDIWPEYDRPDVLVIYRITLSSALDLPAQVSVDVPRGVEINSLAWQDVDGSLYTLTYSTQVMGDWLKITFSAPSAKVQVEYYDSNVAREQTTRSFNFSWVSTADVNDLAVDIQQPVNASNMQISPDFGAGQTQSDGLVYYTKDIGKVSEGTPLQIGFQYQKGDDTLSANQQPVQASSPATGKTDMGKYLPWALIGLAAVLILVGLGWYFGSRGTVRVQVKPRRHAPAAPAARKEAPGNGAPTVVHCHRCGRKASPGDLYCRTCGTRLRN